jgi:hypothetical protein
MICSLEKKWRASVIGDLTEYVKQSGFHFHNSED